MLEVQFTTILAAQEARSNVLRYLPTALVVSWQPEHACLQATGRATVPA